MVRKLLVGFASIAVASVASGFFVIVIDPITSAGAQGWSPAFSVNRTLKGDRLQSDQVPMSVAVRSGAMAADGASRAPMQITAQPKKAPVGCDPSFSPVVSPSLANIFGRCTT